MRSLLIAPADEKRLAEALMSGADAVIVDLAGAAPAERAGARAVAARFLKEARGKRDGPVLIVRANALDLGETDSDLDVVMAGAPDAILLPGSLGAASVQQLSAKLAVREADLSLVDGGTKIIAVADTARALFGMGSYRGSSARLTGIAWSAASLRADIGARTNRDRFGDHLGPYRLARDLTLLAATSAGVAALDAVFPDLHDKEGLRAEALSARRDGFAGKMAIDSAQVGVINDVFPSRRAPLSATHSSAFFDRVQTTLMYPEPSPCTRSVRAIIVCAFNAHIIGLSTVGPRTTSSAVFT
jgi:citrate lyase subunit beta / citryl-CoA lyase